MATILRNLPFGPEQLVPFTNELFDREEETAAPPRILFISILQTRSPPRKSDWSQVFFESAVEGANYRTIDRALPKKLDAKKALMRLYDPESPFVLVDPTASARSNASRPRTPATSDASPMARRWASG